MAQIRQLHFESHTLVIAQLTSQVESPVAETAQPKKIPQSERLSRMKRLKDELSGVLIENEVEPSTSLLEYAVHLEQCDILRYIPVEKCQSRHFEMQHSKPKKAVEIDGSSLKISESSQVPTQDANTAFEVQQALRRRGLAVEFANLISWPVHERYVSYLFHQFTQGPPPGFSKITIAQILRADREAFNQASETCPHIRALGDGTRPLDDVFKNIFQMHQVSFHLLPTVTSKKVEKEPHHKYQWAPYSSHDDSSGYSKGKGKGKKGKQKGCKGKQKGDRIVSGNLQSQWPSEKEGVWPMTLQDRPYVSATTWEFARTLQTGLSAQKDATCVARKAVSNCIHLSQPTSHLKLDIHTSHLASILGCLTKI